MTPLDPPDVWRVDAACNGAHPDLFFREAAHVQAAAKKVCRRCACIDTCLRWALAHDEHGIWGGTTESERRRLRRRQRGDAA